MKHANRPIDFLLLVAFVLLILFAAIFGATRCKATDTGAKQTIRGPFNVYVSGFATDAYANSCTGTATLRNTFHPGGNMAQGGAIRLRCAPLLFGFLPPSRVGAYEAGDVTLQVNGNYFADCRVVDVANPFGDLTFWLEC